MPAYFKDGIPLTWEEKGQGLPLVLLHPFPLHSGFWACQRESLSDIARVITPDFRGFGGSGQDGRISTMDLLADDLAALLEYLELERVILGGLSMGGYVAMAFLRTCPARVRAFILADTRPQADTPEGRQAREDMAILALTHGSSAVADQMLPKLLGRTALQTRPDLVNQVRAMVESTSPAAIAAASRGMAQRLESIDMLRLISCPVLVVSGEEDILTTAQAAESWAREIPGAGTKVLHGAGHLASLEQPQAFNELVKRFIDSIR